MKLSIIILNYKSVNLVKYGLRRVLNFKLPYEWELVVVDNNSHDRIEEMMAKEFPDVKFIQSKKNIGMGRGNNLGIEHSDGEYIIIANPDVTLNEKAISYAVEWLEKNKRAGAVGPKVLSPDGSSQDTCYRWPRPLTFLYRRTWFGRTKKGRQHLDNFLYRDKDLNQPFQADWILGGCLMARRQALDKIGLFDPRFFLFLEDTDLCRRLWQNHWEVWYLPQAEVMHLPHRLSHGWGGLRDIFSKYTWIHIASWVKYFAKWKTQEQGTALFSRENRNSISETRN